MIHLSAMHMVDIFSLFFGLPLIFMVFFDKLVFKVSLLLDGHFGEGNGTPLQYSCLENPMDGGAW